MSLQNAKKLAQRDYLRRLASMKEERPANTCRSWIALIDCRWRWSGNGALQLKRNS